MKSKLTGFDQTPNKSTVLDHTTTFKNTSYEFISSKDSQLSSIPDTESSVSQEVKGREILLTDHNTPSLSPDQRGSPVLKPVANNKNWCSPNALKLSIPSVTP